MKRLISSISNAVNTTKLAIAAVAALAVSSLAVMPVEAQSIGGGIGISVLGSQAGGGVSGGGAGGNIQTILGANTQQGTQSATTTTLAGTKLELTKNGASIVSEHQSSGAAQQTFTGGALGGALSGGFGTSTFTGGGFSAGQWAGINGFAAW